MNFGPQIGLGLIQNSIQRAKLASNQARKDEACKRIDYYKGDQLGHLENILARQFAHPERLKLQMQFSNITRRIINEVSVVYKRPAQRRLMLGGSPIEGPKAEAYQKMLEDARIDAVLKKVNRYANLLNTILVQAVWRNERVELDILTPDMVNVVQDAKDPTRASAVIIEQTYPDTVTLEGPGNPYGARRLFIAWTAEQHQVYDEQGRARPDMANEDGVNPYGLIPMAVFRDAYPDGFFWNEGAADLINAQESINVKLTELNSLIKMQSFSIPVIIGQGPVGGITIDPSNYLEIPLADAIDKGQPDFKFVSPDPKIKDLLEAISEDVRRIADDWGLSMDSFKLSGSPSSGLSLKLQNVRLIERREDDVALYRDYEKDLFRVMRAVHNAHAAPADAIPEDAELSVNFAELEFPEDPAAEDARWITRINQGVASRAQWIMAIDSDIKTEEEAEERILENQEFNARTRGASVSDPAAMAAALGLSGSGKAPKKDSPAGPDVAAGDKSTPPPAPPPAPQPGGAK